MPSAMMWMLLFVLLAASSWAIMIVLVPRSVTSHFRYRLWQIRDDIVDLELAGEINSFEHPAYFRLLRTVERSIAFSRRLTLVRFALLPRLPKQAEAKLHEKMQKELDSLSEIDRHRITEMYQELERAVTLHVCLGSPVGWALLLCAAGVAAFVVLGKVASRPIAVFKEAVVHHASRRVHTRERLQSLQMDGEADGLSASASLVV